MDHIANPSIHIGQLDIFSSQMKPLFSYGREKEVYLPGDPRRRDLEEEWLRAGLNLEDQPITVDNGKASKVSHLST